MKKKNKSYGKLLLASAVSVVLCAFMLAGTTWAWFTDSVTNTGNSIQAGTLKISAASAEVDPAASEKPFTVAGFNGDAAFGFGAAQNLESAGPMISAQNWEPGTSDAKLLSVKNTGTLAAKINLRFTVTDGGLADALWFDFVQVSADNAVTGTFTRRPMSTLAAFAEGIEIPLAGAGYEVRFLFLYGMNEGAGNAYQNASFEVSVTVLAKQMSAEVDGFGDTIYDKDAEYPVTDAVSLKSALTGGGTVNLKSSLILNPEDTASAAINVRSATTLNLNGNSVKMDFGAGVNNFAFVNLVGGRAGLIVNGEGVIDTYGTESGYCFNVAGSSRLQNPKLTINGGTYIGTPTAVNVVFGTAYINGGFFDCRPVGNVTEDQYRYTLNCVDANYGRGATIIVTGGTFVNFNPADNQAEGPNTNFVADGYKVISETKTNGEIWYTVVPE